MEDPWRRLYAYPRRQRLAFLWRAIPRKRFWKRVLGNPSTPIVLWLLAVPAHAERIENQVAVFSALDKVTAHISKFEVELNKTVTFGMLKVTPRACYSRPPTEEPKTTTFVEVDEVQLDGKEKRIFTGWMFAESPGIYGVEHPTFDVWLTECQKPAKTVAQKPAGPPPPAGTASKKKDGNGWEVDANPADGAGPDAPPVDTAPAGDVPRRRVRR